MQEVRKHNIRVTALTPSTVATEMAKDLKLTDGNPENVMQAEDVAELIIAQLKLNRRVFIKDAGIGQQTHNIDESHITFTKKTIKRLSSLSFT
jgi:short-subunit dehydrogenase